MRISIFKRTILMISISFFVMLGSVFGGMYYTSIKAVKEQTLESAQSNLEMIRTYLDMMLDRLTNSMYLYAQSDVLLSEDQEAIQNFFINYSETYDDIASIMLLEGEDVVAISKPMLISNRSIDTSQYYIMAKKNRLVVTSPYYSAPLAGRAIALIRSLVDKETGRERLLVAEIRPQNLFSPLSAKLTSRETLVVLTPKGDTVYFDYSSSIVGDMVSNNGQLDIGECLRSKLVGLGMGITELEINGQNMAIKRLRYNQLWRLYIIAEYSLFYDALIHMMETYLLFAVLSVLLLLLLSIVISAGIVRPVKQLSEQVDRLSPQSSSLEVPVHRKDEIGRLAISFNSLMERLQEAGREKAEIERAQLEMEYKMLQSQIKPHFLFNIHMCINALLEQGRSEEARKMLLSLDSLLRKSTDKIGQRISLEEELQTVEQYGALQRIRLGDTFDITIEGWEPFAQVKVPKLLLQPIVENSIYHGFARIDRRGEIRIQCMEIEGFLHIIIEDNGCGIPQETMKKIIHSGTFEQSNHSGMVSIGIANVRQRIANLYGDGCGLYILSRENIGTRVEIVVSMD
jgi:two-component system sensor histidine kinase YesM